MRDNWLCKEAHIGVLHKNITTPVLTQIGNLSLTEETDDIIILCAFRADFLL